MDVQQSASQWRTFRQQILNGDLVSNHKQNEEVILFFDDGSQYPIKGKLSLTEVQVDEASGNVTLRAVFDNPEQILLPGMAVRATFCWAYKKRCGGSACSFSNAGFSRAFLRFCY